MTAVLALALACRVACLFALPDSCIRGRPGQIARIRPPCRGMYRKDVRRCRHGRAQCVVPTTTTTTTTSTTLCMQGPPANYDYCCCHAPPFENDADCTAPPEVYCGSAGGAF